MVIGFECDVVVVGVWCVSNFFSLFEIGAKKTEFFFAGISKSIFYTFFRPPPHSFEVVLVN